MKLIKKPLAVIFAAGGFIVLILGRIVFAEDALQSAETLAKQGDYKTAYEKLRDVVDEKDSEIKNLSGLVEFYKNETEKLKNEGAGGIVYSEAANALWASAWNLQHDAIFKKTGRDREEYLEKAIGLYRQITIEYSDSTRAEEAQYRVARLYYKFLRDSARGRAEFEKYIGMYPNGKYAAEATDVLGKK